MRAKTPKFRLCSQSRVKKSSPWTAGDLNRDLDSLEQAIAFANADQNLIDQERAEMLNAFAKQRKPVGDDMIRFLFRPLLVSSFLAAALNLSKKSSLCGHVIPNYVGGASFIHFLTCVVIAPVALWLGKIRSRRQKEDDELPTELKGLDPEYFQFVTTSWKNPRTSCKDYVFCLLEQWTSAVAGIAAISPFLLRLPNSARLSIQIIVRFGTLASLHQFPKLIFKLNRKEQPLPMQWPVWTLRSLTRCLVTPWAIAVDVACLASQFPVNRICSSFVVLLSGVAGTAVLVRLATPENPRLTELLKSRPPMRTMVRAAAIAIILGRRQSLIDSSKKLLMLSQSLSMGELISSIPWTNVLYLLAALIACFGPLCHIFCIQKLFIVSYNHALSLALGTEQFERELTRIGENHDGKSTDVDQRQSMWRYKLSWREPQRIRTVLDQWRSDFWYWLFVSGSVEDQLRKEYKERLASAAKSRGLTVWQKMREDKLNQRDIPFQDRSDWKRDAMDIVAKRHQDDIDRNTVADPLGLAIYKTFGIGLGYNFEHMSELQDGEVPSSRRLQARAAKSALKRYQEIFDPTTAKKELESIEDPQERNRKAAELRAAAEVEIKEIARRLSELIPVGGILKPENELGVQQFYENSFEQARTRSPAVNGLLKNQIKTNSQDEIDYMNPMGLSIDEKDEAFIEEWTNRHLGERNVTDTTEDSDADDDVTRTVLA